MDGERRPRLRGRFDLDGSTVALDDPVDDEQPEPEMAPVTPHAPGHSMRCARRFSTLLVATGLRLQSTGLSRTRRESSTHCVERWRSLSSCTGPIDFRPSAY